MLNFIALSNVEKFDAYDGAVKTAKNVGKALASGWKTVTSWFGG
ncbi:hypothetical protein STRDD13_00967 [Streptococcus sp. DD13]|nr:hypothetical protein STRDD13_00967 [Streptococcus sp. DD13]